MLCHPWNSSWFLQAGNSLHSKLCMRFLITIHLRWCFFCKKSHWQESSSILIYPAKFLARICGVNYHFPNKCFQDRSINRGSWFLLVSHCYCWRVDFLPGGTEKGNGEYGNVRMPGLQEMGLYEAVMIWSTGRHASFSRCISRLHQWI